MEKVKLPQIRDPKEGVLSKQEQKEGEDSGLFLCIYFAGECLLLTIFFPFYAFCPGQLSFESSLRT